MTRIFLFLFAALLALSLCALDLPLPIHAGRLESYERSLAAQSFISQEKAVQNKTFEAGLDNEALRESRSPDEEQAFVIFKVSVLPQRSISRFDYELVIEGRAYKCQSMALANQPDFDFRLLETTGPQELLLLFSVPEKAKSASLRSRFAQLPMPAISGLTLQETEESAETDDKATEDKAEDNEKKTPETETETDQ